MLPTSFHGRRFEIWTYLVSHRQLLLRSNKSEQDGRRCEILFTNVAYVNLPILIENLEIRRAIGETMTSAVANLGIVELVDKVVYVIRGRNCVGHIVAGGIAVNEDDGEYYSPSRLLQI